MSPERVQRGFLSERKGQVCGLCIVCGLLCILLCVDSSVFFQLFAGSYVLCCVWTPLYSLYSLWAPLYCFWTPLYCVSGRLCIVCGLLCIVCDSSVFCVDSSVFCVDFSVLFVDPLTSNLRYKHAAWNNVAITTPKHMVVCKVL